MEDSMCKRKKKVAPAVAEVAPANPFDSFELKKPESAYDANGNRDYFTEYYNAYKNDYIDQYLNAYKKFKEEGKIAPFTPYAEEENKAEVASDFDPEVKDETEV